MTSRRVSNRISRVSLRLELERTLLSPFDFARRRLLQAALRHSLLGPLLKQARSRIAMRVLLAIGVAFALTAIAPAFALAIGPIVFGVPHVASSLRHIVLRSRMTRTMLIAIGLFSSAIVAVRVLEQITGSAHGYARIEVLLGVLGSFAAALAAGLTRRSAIVLAALVALGGVMLLFPLATRLAFVHVHNLGVIVLWLLVFRRRGEAWPLLLLALGIALVVLLGHAGVFPIIGSGWGVDLAVTQQWLLPGAPADIALPLLLVHALTDSVHYAFWLGVVPDEAARAEGSLTFRMTARSLRRDFGRYGLALVVLATVLVPFAALFRLEAARHAYFVFAGFHGYIEGFAIVYVIARGMPLVGRVRHT